MKQCLQSVNHEQSPIQMTQNNKHNKWLEILDCQPKLLLIMYCNNSANTLIAVVHLTRNIFRQLPAFTCYFHCITNDTLHK